MGVQVCKQSEQEKMELNANIQWLWVGTNLIHNFTAVTFSVKLAFFREKRRFREIRDFS